MEIAGRLADVIADLASGRPRLAVAFDGPDAAGKTTLADRVARRLGQPVIRAGVDGFHQPRQVRYQRGSRSAEGYYRDSFDYPAITGQCLAPFRDGAPVIRTAGFGFRADAARDTWQDVPAAAVLIFDGVFLLRPELAGRGTARSRLICRAATSRRPDQFPPGLCQTALTAARQRAQADDHEPLSDPH